MSTATRAEPGASQWAQRRAAVAADMQSGLYAHLTAQVNFEQALAGPRVVYGANELSIQRFETNVATLVEPSLRCRSGPHLNERGTDDAA
jgi:hypothetical protein